MNDSEPQPENAPQPVDPAAELPPEALPTVVGSGKGTLRRINGYLHRVVPIFDRAGQVVNYAIHPVMVEFRPRDVAQVMVGAVILGVPVMLSDEAMTAAANLPRNNIVAIALLSVGFIAGFVYFNFYRNQFKAHAGQYVKRVLVTYFLTLLVVAGMLQLFELSPWGEDPILALRRTLLVAFPASLFATIADTVK
ncbi:MAG: DUF2391 family protein [Planctomycetota bacterium]